MQLEPPEGPLSGELCPDCAQDYFALADIDVVDGRWGVGISWISATYRRAERWEIRPENPAYRLARHRSFLYFHHFGAAERW